MRWRPRAGPLAGLLTAAVALLVLLGCGPPPPPAVPPAPPSSPAPGALPRTELAIGVDELAGGFNPHTLADLSPTTTLVADVLLPSAFRPALDGTWQLDRTLLRSAEQTSEAPFTITYRLRDDAAWSDTAPIAAEDFGYLAEQMATQPGVVDPAGYRLIDEVRSGDGGKTVDVVFRSPYPGWRTLFGDLLPAHLLKDAPGGWADALDAGLPVSGGPYSIRSTDPAGGSLVLERNERYWASPAVLDRVLLREADGAALAETLRIGDQQVAVVDTPDAIDVSTLAALGSAAQSSVAPRPVLASVLLRPGSPRLADERLRRAVAAALDRDSLIATGTASGPSARLRADAHVFAPSQSGYRPTLPRDEAVSRADPQQVQRLLTAAGYRRGPDGWSSRGRPLRLTVAAPADRYPYVTLAQRVRDQLAEVGIAADVVTPDGDELFGERFTAGDPGADAASGTRDGAGSEPGAGPEPGTADTGAGADADGAGGVDIAVVPQPVGGDPATVLASAYGCPPVPPAGEASAPPNPAGFCDVALQPFIDGALTGTVSIGDALEVVEPELWAQLPAIPLFQPAVLVASTDDVQGVGPQPLLAGPFANLPRWRRPG